jgi:ferredoxin-thioredoxin reductase catalytic subunit
MSIGIKAVLEMQAAKYGYEIISEERLEILAKKFKQIEAETGELYCPCQPNRTEDTICPCRFMREHNACRCGLYKQGG